MSTPDRGVVRQALGAMLKAACNTAQEVYTGQVASFDAQSPVVVVTSGSSARERITMQGSIALFEYDVHLFVVYSEPESGWNELMAEDALDALEAEVARFVDMSQQTRFWQSISYAQPSNARQPVVIGGLEYRHELITLALNVM